jgi:hypothetical protein
LRNPYDSLRDFTAEIGCSTEYRLVMCCGQIEGRPDRQWTTRHLNTSRPQWHNYVKGLPTLEASAAVLDSVLACMITMDSDGRVLELQASAGLREFARSVEPQKRTTWQEFLLPHWEVLAAADFFTVEVWTGASLTRRLRR